MNIILLKSGETCFLRNDIRYTHIKKILKLVKNDVFQCGIINGSRGNARIESFSDEKICFRFLPETQSLPFENLIILMGTPRPPVAKRLLKDLTSMGVKEICFVKTDLGEKSYLESNLWKDENYLKHLIEGAQQGGSTLIPEVRRFYSLNKAIGFYKSQQICNFIHCDLPGYSEGPLFDYTLKEGESLISIGPERGWSQREREYFNQSGFNSLSLNSRIMRTESAAILAAGIMLNKI